MANDRVAQCAEYDVLVVEETEKWVGFVLLAVEISFKVPH